MYVLIFAILTLMPKQGVAALKCENAGPQSPRDITDRAGSNPIEFPLAPPAQKMNLCNIHTHTNAEYITCEEYSGIEGKVGFAEQSVNQSLKRRMTTTQRG